jgi:hypothetical protein
MLNMNSSRRIAFPLAVLLHLMVFYMLSKQSFHTAQSQSDRPPLIVTLLPFIAPQPVIKPPEIAPQHESKASPVQTHVAKETHTPQPITPSVAAPSTAPAQKLEVEPPTSQSGALLAQSALNAIGKIDQDERGGAGRGLGVSTESGSLGSRLSAAIDKHGAYKAGVIEEHVYPDGRREERIHTLLGDYCITYESTSDPKDGFDTMQRGYQRSVPHTCGHRFD